MAAALIDEAVVHRLLETALDAIPTASAGKVAVMHLGDEEPDAAAWVALDDVQLERGARQRGDGEPDAGELTLVVGCFVDARQSSAYAIGAVKSFVAAALRGATLVDPASGTVEHQVDLQTMTSALVPHPDPEREIVAAKITVTGMVHRHTGTSIASVLA